MKLNLSENKKFSKFSGDQNKIHISNNQAKKFFIKKPIVHGANILIKAFKKSKFLETRFNYLDIQFKDFININEFFSIHSNKNSLIIKGSYNNKIEIIKKNLNYKLCLNKKDIIKELLFISKYIGNTSPGQNSIIQQISFNYSKLSKKKRLIKKRKVNKNVIIIYYSYKNVIAEITALKLKPYKELVSNKIIKNKKTINLIKNKKIIIFGKNSDFGNFLFNSNVKNYCRVYVMSSKNFNKKILKKNLKKIKPDFIFYFFTPKIINGKSRKLYNNFLDIYCKIPKDIFNINSKYKKKFKIFYPSTVFISHKEKYKYLKSYIKAKKKSETEFNKNYYKKTFSIIRLPQIKTRSNYNPLLGLYLGKSLKYLSDEIENFLKKNVI